MALAQCSPLMMSPTLPIAWEINNAGAAMSAIRPAPGSRDIVGSPRNRK